MFVLWLLLLFLTFLCILPNSNKEIQTQWMISHRCLMWGLCRSVSMVSTTNNGRYVISVGYSLKLKTFSSWFCGRWIGNTPRTLRSESWDLEVYYFFVLPLTMLVNESNRRRWRFDSPWWRVWLWRVDGLPCVDNPNLLIQSLGRGWSGQILTGWIMGSAWTSLKR